MMTRAVKVLKGIFCRVWGTGKVTLLAAVMALTLFTASTAFAANGGNFILGVATNTATAITQLTANIANPALKVVNTNTSTGATALNLQTATSKPPMTVNSKTKVANLNADSVDGKSAEQLTRVANKIVVDTTPVPTNAASVAYGTPLSITAPAAGFVRVNGNVTVQNSGCNISCVASGWVRHINTGESSMSSQHDLGNFGYANMGLDGVFPVSAGVNTFEIRLSRFSTGNGTLNGWLGALTAEYTPYGSTGTGTLSTASAASEPSQEELDKKKQQAETQQEQ